MLQVKNLDNWLTDIICLFTYLKNVDDVDVNIN